MMDNNSFNFTLKKTAVPADTLNSVSRSAKPVSQKREENSGDLELLGACKDFEAILLRQLMSTMRKSIPKSELFGESYAREMYQTLQDEALADHLVQGHGTGLGEVLYRQLSGQDRRTAGN